MKNIEDRRWSVYKHTSPSGKVYIGITSREPSVRWGKNGIHYKGQPFYYAIEKYGWDNISHEVLYKNLTEDEAKEIEVEQIAKHRSKEREYGYNCTFGGDGTLGFTRSQESINGTIDGNIKTVYQYSIDGDFIKEWKSAITIERELGYSATCVGSCCLGRRKQAYGYIWRHDYVEKDIPTAWKLSKGYHRLDENAEININDYKEKYLTVKWEGNVFYPTLHDKKVRGSKLVRVFKISNNQKNVLD